MLQIDFYKKLITQRLSEMGLELVELKFIRAGSKSVLRIYIDKPGGVTIADCERASSQLSIILDVENFSQTPYTLEISSPGIDRPLITERDFQRVVGKKVLLRIQGSDLKSATTLKGTVMSCVEGIIRIQSEDSIHETDLRQIISGKLELPF